MDIQVRYPGAPGPLGLWPSAVAVTTTGVAPLTFNYQEALEHYRVHQAAYGVLWKESDNGTEADYKIFPESFDADSLSPDFRRTERGDFELVGVWSIPDQPPPDTGGSLVPSHTGPSSGHPSGRL